MDETLFHGPNAGYVLELFERYQRDPASVDAATRAIFERWTPSEPAAAAAPGRARVEAPAARPADATLRAVAGLIELVRGIREYGHLAARIDPLGSDPPGDPELDPATHGLRVDDLASLPASLVDSPVAAGARHALDAVLALRRVYSGTIGYDYDHVQVAEERLWLRGMAEAGHLREPLDPAARRRLLDRLTQVEVFERYLHQHYPGQKRFSIEGTDVLVPMLDEAVQLAAAAGTREVVMGMAHRGRLNVLAHVLGKPYEAILAEFHHPDQPDDSGVAWEGTDTGWQGDVKYHLGARTAYQAGDVVRIPITMAPNPSHLEFVNPVVEGMARAAQERRDQPGPPHQDEASSLALLMHGDAAFPGQGIVPETLNLSRLAGYRTGGTLHIIVNNQLGFTSEPSEARSTLYASDLAKGFEIPIVHVNADDPEACLAAIRLGLAYRQRFRKDFLIDLVGYRRWGHNEGDEPAFTQPLLYQRIAEHPTVRERWARELERLGVVTGEEAEAMVRHWMDRMAAAARGAPAQVGAGEVNGRSVLGAPQTLTAVPAEALRTLNRALLERPPDFTIHPRLERLLQRRVTALDDAGGIDWAHAETLAFATILADGTPIRLTGQDTQRGTFSQRHLALHDVQTGARYTPLQNLPPARAAFAVYNSPLSENSTLGFEFGFSVYAAETLVLWEAQFGDFANSAQVIIDQFIVSARAKWRQTPSLVLLLPHGYEGQGPEHSSARLERFIQLAATDNIRVVNCTTAGQYFHLLRRQAGALRSDPRPLVVMTPKSLLRHPLAVARLEDLSQGHFQPLIDDPMARARPHAVNRLVLCSGKIAIDLIGSSMRAQAETVAVARVEELYPFPVREIEETLAAYPNLREIIWVQEEPRNMGAWRYMAPRLRTLAGPERPVSYIGRARRASPAEGLSDAHTVEQARIVEAAFVGVPEPPLVEEHGVRHAG
jgi:2-oxoglutarate dehydrogenase E1 component